MTTTSELNQLAEKAAMKGAVVCMSYDADGCVSTVEVSGLIGCGPFPMSPISAAERLRGLV